MRHSAGTLLVFAKRFLDLAHLGPLEMANFRRKLFQGSPNQGQGRDVLGVAVALQGLGRDRGGLQAERRANIVFQVGRHIGMGAGRAGDFADCDILAGFGQAAAMPAHFVHPYRQFEAEGERFGVHAVGPANHNRIFVLDGLAFEDGQQLIQILPYQVERFHGL